MGFCEKRDGYTKKTVLSPHQPGVGNIDCVASQDEAGDDFGADPFVRIENQACRAEHQADFHGHEQVSIVLRIPIGNRTLESPIGQGEEMPVCVIVVEREVLKNMEHHAEEEQDGKFRFFVITKEKAQGHEGEGVEGINEILPGGVIVVLPNQGFRDVSN